MAEEFIVDLEDIKNRLNDQDRSQMLKNHCNQNGLSLSVAEQSTDPLTEGNIMYPLLCKLFCSDSEYRTSGKEFFEKPYACIIDQMDSLKGYRPLQYASLVLCMFCPNEITEGSFRKQDPRLMEIKKIVFENCRVSGLDTEINDALNSMLNTFTTFTNKGYSLIHDSVYEVLAFHYGNKHQEDMLQYMSSSFVAKKINVNDISDDPVDLHIQLNKKHYPAFAERLVRDLKSLELYDVFMNEALKEPCICNAFIDELKKLSYHELKELFFIKQEDTSKIFIRKDEEIKKRRTEKTYEYFRQEHLMGETQGKPNIRTISWVITYGHYQLLQFLFDLLTEHKESLCRVMDSEITEESRNRDISDLQEQTRLLTLSCYNDNVEVVKLILKHCGVNCIKNDFAFTYTPLAIACLVGHKSVVELLIKCGANCNEISIFSPSPLYAATEAGHVEVVDLLIKCGADCNQSDVFDQSPLHAASLEGHSNVADLLIKGGADCNQSDEEGRTPLYIASMIGYDDIVDMLIKGGADCNQSDAEGHTPLYIASMNGCNDIVNMLIKGGAHCNQRNNQGRSPLYVASLANYENTMDFPFELDTITHWDGNPFDAASLIYYTDIVDLLIKGGADCNQGDEKGRTPLYAASLAGHADVVNLLIKGGADCNQADEEGRTPLYNASQGGHVDVVDVLIKCGADCNQADVEGKTPLYAASYAGHVDVVDFLIKSGADCNKANKKGTTPLHDASLLGHVDVVDLLIKCDADCNRADEEDRTLLNVASRAGHVDVMDFLNKGDAD